MLYYTNESKESSMTIFNLAILGVLLISALVLGQMLLGFVFMVVAGIGALLVALWDKIKEGF